MSQIFKKTGPAYLIDSVEGKKAVLSVYSTSENDQQKIYLTLTDLDDGSILKSTLICTSASFNRGQVIGKVNDQIWVYADSLVAYNVRSLLPAVTESMIAAKNPVLQNNFSEFPNSYQIDESAGVLYINSKNGDGYKLYTADLRLAEDNSASDPTSDKDYQYEFAAYYQVNDRYNLEYAMVNIDTFQNNVYILGSELETGHVTNYFGSQIYSPREENRFVSIVAWKAIEKTGSQLNIKGGTKKRYYKGGFLAEKFFARAWRSKQNEHIILFEDRKQLHIAMVDASGKEIWRVDGQSPLSGFVDYLANDSHFVVWVKNDSPKEADKVIITDLSTGKSFLSKLNNL